MNLHFNENWNSIAVSVSGGADSALLLYLLCKKVTFQTVHIINNIRCWKTKPWQQHDAERVIAWFKSRFPNINFQVHQNFVAPDIEYANIGPTIKDEYGKMVSGDNIQIRAYAEFVCTKYNIDAYYNGVTKNPTDNLNGMSERDIEPNEDNKHLEVMEHMGKLAIHPFRFISKDVIIKMYRGENIQGLFDITRSCEGEFPGLDYTTYKPGQTVPTCGECFWCKEREWAIEQANK
jgi:7-cyano-7-deazaguanine synthase in queuosine biosynthesis